MFICFFFFQAEDGTRDWSVTGVQTCALPIFGSDDNDRLIPHQNAVYSSSERPRICFVAGLCLPKTSICLSGWELYFLDSSLFRCTFFLRHFFPLCSRSSYRPFTRSP